MPRPVDEAMEQDSIPKQFVRKRWVELVTELHDQAEADGRYLYLSLPGRHGKDFAALRDAGLLKVTETGSVSEEEQERFAAVERSGQAVAALKKRFAGLKVVQEDLGSLLRGTGMTRFPNGAYENLFRAAVINLDFSSSLEDRGEDSVVRFPALTLIKKIATIHNESRSQGWGLCVTFNATINWQQESFVHATNVIAANEKLSDIFRESIEAVLGNNAWHAVRNSEITAITMETGHQHRMLAVFVPKKIAELVVDQRWLLEVTGCFRYTSGSGAPMISWIIKFNRAPVDDQRTTHEIYRANVDALLERFGEIDAYGNFISDLQQ